MVIPGKCLHLSNSLHNVIKVITVNAINVCDIKIITRKKNIEPNIKSHVTL